MLLPHLNAIEYCFGQWATFVNRHPRNTQTQLVKRLLQLPRSHIVRAGTMKSLDTIFSARVPRVSNTSPLDLIALNPPLLFYSQIESNNPVTYSYDRSLYLDKFR